MVKRQERAEVDVNSRICNFCKIEKPRKCFFKHKGNKNDIYSFCKDCAKIKRKIYYEKNKHELLNRQRIKRKTKEYKEKNNIRMKEYRKNNPVKQLIMWAKSKCKKRKIPFNLGDNDLVFTGKCAIFGTELVISGDNLDNSPTLDRINPSLGYVRGNVQIVSHLANRIKSSATLDQLEQIVMYVKKHQGEINGNN